MFVPGTSHHLRGVLLTFPYPFPSMHQEAEFRLNPQILKPAEKKQKYVYGGMGSGRPVTPPRKQKKK